MLILEAMLLKGMQQQQHHAPVKQCMVFVRLLIIPRESQGQEDDRDLLVMLRLVKSFLCSSVSLPHSRTGPSVCMPRTRREPQHAVLSASAFESRSSLAGGVDVKIEVEEAFLAVNGFDLESSEAPKPKTGKRKRASKTAAVEEEAVPSTSKGWL